MADVKLVNLKKSYGNVDIIKGVSLDIEHGEFVVFVGPSGCGKSTLLRMISGLEEITGGELWIDGKRVNEAQPRERGIAMVFQSYAIFPHMTVRENIGFGLTLAGTPKAERERAVNEAARILQMEHLLDRKPSQLSGGQRQRVAIGRSIVRKPKVFLFDEPLSNLDAALRVDMRMEIGKLHKDLGATMIYVTHDQVEAMTLADKIVVLRAGEVMQVGSPLDLYHNPANQFVAGFLGSPKMNFLDVEVKEAANGRVTVASPALEPVSIPHAVGSFAAGGRATLGVRPQFLHPGQFADRGHLHGRVTLVERLGTETVLNIEMPAGGRIVVAARSTSATRSCSASSPSARIFSRRRHDPAASMTMCADATAGRSPGPPPAASPGGCRPRRRARPPRAAAG
jgi:multiple sugar transport system ATP-binding protein